MKEIDFRPNWYCVTRKRKRDAIIRATLLGLLAAELGLGLLTVSSRKAEAQQQLAKLRSALNNQVAVYENLSEAVADLNELQVRRVLLSDVAGGAPVHAILADLSKLLPESIALTAVSYQQQRWVRDASTAENSPTTKPDVAQLEKPNMLEIKGLAAQDRDIGAMMSRMAASALFTNVTLVYSQPVTCGALAVREFALTCAVPQFE